MTLELEIDVPESRQVTLSLPPEVPVGKVRLTVRDSAPPELVMTFVVNLNASQPPKDGGEKFQQERAAFYRLLPELLKTHRGKYVAIHDEQIVAEGVDDSAVTAEAYARVGYVELYVGEVTDAPRVVRIASPRLVRKPTP